MGLTFGFDTIPLVLQVQFLDPGDSALALHPEGVPLLLKLFWTW